MQWKTDPPCRILPAPGTPPGRSVPHLHASLWLEIEVWNEAVRGHFHLMAPEKLARSADAWRIVDVATHPFEVLEDGPGVPPDAGALVEHALARLEFRFYRSQALGAVSRLGEPLGAFRSRLLGALRPEITHRVETCRGNDRVGEELSGAVSRVGGSFEEMVVGFVPDQVRRGTVGMVLVPEGLELREPAPWDHMAQGAVRGPGRP